MKDKFQPTRAILERARDVFIKNIRWAALSGFVGGLLLVTLLLIRHPYEFNMARFAAFAVFNILATTFIVNLIIISILSAFEFLVGAICLPVAYRLRSGSWVPIAALFLAMSPFIASILTFGVWNGKANFFVASCIVIALVVTAGLSCWLAPFAERKLKKKKECSLIFGILFVLLIVGYLAPILEDRLLEPKDECESLGEAELLCRPKKQVASTNVSRYKVVVYLTIDTLRADHLGCFGYPRTTSPNIDALAEESLLFQRMVAISSGTVPSFGTMMTGHPPWVTKVTHQACHLHEDLVTIAELFSKQGYRTVGVSTNGFLIEESGFAQGFDEYIYLRRVDAPQAVEKAEQLVKKRLDLPLFLWVHFIDPHTPYDPRKETLTDFMGDDLYRTEKINIFDYGSYGGVQVKRIFGPEWRKKNDPSINVEEGEVTARYDGEIRIADEGVGLILKLLNNLGVKDESAILLTADHGETLNRGPSDYCYQHALDVYDSALHVPAILWRSDFRTGQRVEGLYSHLDLVPTLIELGGLDLGDSDPVLPGRSLLSQNQADEWVISQSAWWDGLSLDMLSLPFRRPSYALVRDSFKFVAYPHTDLLSVRGPFSLLHAWRMAVLEMWRPDELYDLSNDPLEKHDLFHENVVLSKSMRRQLKCLISKESKLNILNVRSKDSYGTLDDDTLERLKALGYID